MEQAATPPTEGVIDDGACRITAGIAGVRTRAGGHQTLMTVRAKADERVVVKAVGESGLSLQPVTA